MRFAGCAAARPDLQSFVPLRYGRGYAGAFVADVCVRAADEAHVKGWVELHDGWEEVGEIPPQSIGWGRSWRDGVPSASATSSSRSTRSATGVRPTLNSWA